MTARAAPSVNPGLPEPRQETATMPVCLGLACLVHAVALLLPLTFSELRPPLGPPAPANEPPRIVRPLLRPPEMPQADLTLRPVERRTPVAFEESPDLEPIEESRSENSGSIQDPIVDLPMLVAAGQPPPAPLGAVEVGTPGLVEPLILVRVEPVYPPIAVQARRGGTVVLDAVVGPDGRVEEIRVLSAPRPDLGFSQAAVAAVAAWRYRPGSMHGRPVAVRLHVTVDFSLVP